MSKLSKLKVATKTTEVEYPDIEGFRVTLCYLSREELAKIRNRCLKVQYNKITRQREETLDAEKFTEEYARKAIVAWTGLKLKDLHKLLPVDDSALESLDLEEELEYSSDEAVELLKSSISFDRFITETMDDLENFAKEQRKTDEKN